MYEPPRTPYQRVLELGALQRNQRQQLEQRYRSLNPVQLRTRMDHLQTQLWDLVERREQGALPKQRRHGPGITIRRRISPRTAYGD